MHLSSAGRRAAVDEQPTQAAREARLAGIRDRSTLSLQTVERRRRQLWGIAFVVMASLAIGITLLGAAPGATGGLTRLPGIRYGQPLMIVGLFAYLVEKEAHLRRLSLLLFAERVVVEREQARLAELLEVDRINTGLASDVEYEVARSLSAVIERLRTVRERHTMASPLDATLASVETELETTSQTVEEIVAHHRAALDQLLRREHDGPPRDVPELESSAV
ncbi:MAG: hypothetical protein E6G06_08595 [Actinobacteria bacterium]|nr:MAG: hypothetical protein E6G06_08595 [Actinomycetota bacterium]